MANNKDIWSKHEITVLKEIYATKPISECADILHRSVSSIYAKAFQLGFRKQRQYCDAEILIVISGYYEYGPLAISKELDRTCASIRDLAVRLGLSVSKKRIRSRGSENRAKWTEESIQKKSESQKKYRGPLSPSWKGGCCTLNEIVRGRLHAVWAKPIIYRDNRKCVLCGEHRSKKIVVHHVRPFAQIRDLVIARNKHLSIDNYDDLSLLADLVVEEHGMEDGVTLCRVCHRKHHLENGVNCGDILPDISEDNPQPSPPKLRLIVGGKVQRLMDEDSATDKSDTSAPHIYPIGVIR